VSLVVYTAISQNYDPLRTVLKPDAVDRYVAYVDIPGLVPPWECLSLDRKFSDPNRRTKQYKILPHQFLGDSELTIWMDGKMELTAPVAGLLAFVGDAEIAAFEHSLRCCLYEEACECVHRRLDDPALIYHQVQRYTREQFPANYGLYDCAVLVRRNTPKVREFCGAWWHEIENGSRRDQLSFTYCAWKYGLKIKRLPGTTHVNPFFRLHQHLRSSPPPAGGPSTGSS
jgi:hypothetical protein